MKTYRNLFASIATITLLTLTPLISQVQAENFYFYFTDSEAILETIDGTDPVVTIPSTAFDSDSGQSLPVTTIFDANSSVMQILTIPNSVTNISGYAFSSCPNLTSITIGDGLPNLGAFQFSDYPFLDNVTLGQGITEIEVGTFQNCSNLTRIYLGQAVTSIGDEAFRYCSKLISLSMPNTVTNLGALAFESCQSLSTVDLSQLLTEIQVGTFLNCTNLSSLSLGSLVTNIGAIAFASCNSLTRATVLADVPGGPRLLIPDSLISIGDAAFAGCLGLNYVVLPDSVTYVGVGAFEECPSMTSFTVHNYLRGKELYFGALAFEGCTNLTSFDFPDDTKRILDDTFMNCGHLTSVTIGSGVTNISAIAFEGCTNLTSIVVSPFNPVYSSVLTPYTYDGVLFNKAATTLIQYPYGRFGSYVIPNTVTTIGNDAFALCWRLTDVGIPDSVLRINDSAFNQCSSLSLVVIPNSVTNMGLFCFASCPQLRSALIPSGLTLPDWAFWDCPNLTGAFFLGTPPPFGAEVFSGDNVATVYYLPEKAGWGATYAGRPTAQWRRQIKSAGKNFGAGNHEFGFDIDGAPGMTAVVSACTNLTSPNWIPVSTNWLAYSYTNNITRGTGRFTDPNWAAAPRRFYRAQYSQ